MERGGTDPARRPGSRSATPASRLPRTGDQEPGTGSDAVGRRDVRDVPPRAARPARTGATGADAPRRAGRPTHGGQVLVDVCAWFARCAAGAARALVRGPVTAVPADG